MVDTNSDCISYSWPNMLHVNTGKEIKRVSMHVIHAF